jgi:hypothetical protein
VHVVRTEKGVPKITVVAGGGKKRGAEEDEDEDEEEEGGAEKRQRLDGFGGFEDVDPLQLLAAATASASAE